MPPIRRASKPMSVPPRPKRRSTGKPWPSRSWAMISPRMYDSGKFLEPTTTTRASSRLRRTRASVKTTRAPVANANARMSLPASYPRLGLEGLPLAELRLKESPDVLRGRLPQDGLAGVVLHQAAPLQDDEALGQRERLAQVVGDQ